VVWFLTNFACIKHEGSVVFQPANEPFTTGLKLMVQPTILENPAGSPLGDLLGERVRLHLKLQNASVDPVPYLAPFIHSLTPTSGGGDPIQITEFIQQPAITTVSLEKILVVPDGKTVLLRGWTETETICHRSQSILPFVCPLIGLPM